MCYKQPDPEPEPNDTVLKDWTGATVGHVSPETKPQDAHKADPSVLNMPTNRIWILPEETNTILDAHPVEMITSPTGGRKAQKPCQLGAIDPVALEQLGLVAGYGTKQYGRGNYLQGYAYSLSLDALYRHTLAFSKGENLDPESGLPHMAHAAFHCLALITFMQREIGEDDRPKTKDNQ